MCGRQWLWDPMRNVVTMTFVSRSRRQGQSENPAIAWRGNVKADAAEPPAGTKQGGFLSYRAVSSRAGSTVITEVVSALVWSR